MKHFAYIFLVLLTFSGYAQGEKKIHKNYRSKKAKSVITLKDSVSANRWGMWNTGKYTIYVSLDNAEAHFKDLYETNEKISCNGCALGTASYKKAYEKIKNAGDTLDLKTLKTAFPGEKDSLRTCREFVFSEIHSNNCIIIRHKKNEKLKKVKRIEYSETKYSSCFVYYRKWKKKSIWDSCAESAGTSR